MQDEEVGQNVDHIDRLELAGDTNGQTFVGELVEHVEHPVLASIGVRPQPIARSVGQAEPAALKLQSL